MYYIICLTHTHRHEKFITLWRPDNAGYCWSKGMAGTYESPEPGYHDSEYNMPIKTEDAEGLFIQALYDGEKRAMIPNCQAVWETLGVKMTKHGLERLTPYVKVSPTPTCGGTGNV